MRITVATAVACLLAGMSIADESHAAIKEDTIIPAQGLGPALKQLAADRDVQLVYRSELVGDKQTSGAVGELTFDEALTNLLKGTGLTYQYLDDQAVTIVPMDSSSSPQASGPSTQRSSLGVWERFRLAQVDQEQNPRSSSGSASQSAGDVSERLRNQIEEVIVTATKREERLIDVPMSIVAMSSDELQQRRILRVDDLSMAVPGLAVEGNGMQRVIAIRGISNLYGSSSLTGVYLDETPMTLTGMGTFGQPDVQTYDLERVEVLKGPQGTLYGEGSVGGTVRFITKDPLLDRFDMNADIAAEVTQDGSPSGRITGAMSMPLIENELGLRIAGTYDHQGGWIDQPAIDRENFNEQNLVNVRVKGLWQPAPNFGVSAMAVVHRNEGPGSRGEDANGNFTQAFNRTTTPDLKDEYDLYNLTLTYDFPSVRVLGTAAYVDQYRATTELGQRRQFTPPGTPAFHVLWGPWTYDSKVLSEELRLMSNGVGPWKWTIGGFHRRAESESSTTFYFGLPGAPGDPLPPPFGPSVGDSTGESWAAFADMSYRLTERLTLGAGLRYSQEDGRDDISGQTAGYDATTPRFYAQYELADDVNTYVSAGKGFRSGGSNGGDAPSSVPETAWTYELGTKMSLLDNRLSAEVATFYTDITDYQVIGIRFDLNPPRNVISNAGDVTIKGVEAALTWRPNEQWGLSASGSYLDAEFAKINATSSSHVVGDSPDMVPKYAYTASVQRYFRWSGRSGLARLDYNAKGRMPFRNRQFGPWYFDESDVINMLNLNVSMPWTESLTVVFFAQNLLDERGYTGAGSTEELAPRARPRTLGIEFGVTF